MVVPRSSRCLSWVRDPSRLIPIQVRVRSSGRFSWLDSLGPCFTSEGSPAGSETGTTIRAQMN